MECGVPFCHNGCPLGQPDPGLERPRLPRPLARRDPPAARDEQLPRVHRPAVPGAVRGGLRAGDPRGRRGHDQADRELDHRPRVGRRAGSSRSRRASRPAARSPSSAPGPAGMAAAQQLRRAGHRGRRSSSATRPPAAWSASACRTSRSRSASSSAASQQLRDEGVEVRCGVDVGVDVTVEELRDEFDAVVLATGSRVAARPAGPRPRARRRPLRDGLPLRAQPLGRRRDRTSRRSAPPASTSSSSAAATPARTASATPIREGALAIVQLELLPEPPAAAPRRPHAVAAVAAEVPPVLRDGGGQGARQGRAGLLGRDDALLRRGRPRARRCTPPQAEPDAAVRAAVEGTEFEIKADLVLLAMGFLHPEQRAARPARRRARTSAATRRPPTVRDLGAGRVRRRRRAPRPVAHRVGDQRGPPVRADGRPLPRRPRRPRCPTGTPTRAPRARRRTRGGRPRRPSAVALRLTTDDVGAAERFSYWRELICDTFVGLDAERPGRGFTGSLRSSPLGPLRRTEVRSVAQHVVRSPRQIERGRDDDVLVSVQRCRPRAGPPGRPRGAAAPRRARALRRRAALHADVRRAVRPGGVPAAARLAGRAPGLARRAHGLARDRAARPGSAADGEQALDLLAATLGALLGRAASPAEAHRRAIRLYVERRLGDPDSRRRRSPPRTRCHPATCIGCGRRKSLGDAGPPHPAPAAGARPRGPRTRCGHGHAGRVPLGLPQPAHFSRAYRRHFGAAPSEHRATWPLSVKQGARRRTSVASWSPPSSSTRPPSSRPSPCGWTSTRAIDKAIGLIGQASAARRRARRLPRDLDPRLPVVDLARRARLGDAVRAALLRELRSSSARSRSRGCRHAARRARHPRQPRDLRARRRQPLHGAGPHRRRRARSPRRGASSSRRTSSARCSARAPARISRCVDTRVGKVGSLCCWEHLQPLTRYAMYSKGEQVHCAAWPTFSPLRRHGLRARPGGQHGREPDVRRRGRLLRPRRVRRRRRQRARAVLRHRPTSRADARPRAAGTR